MENMHRKIKRENMLFVYIFFSLYIEAAHLNVPLVLSHWINLLS